MADSYNINKYGQVVPYFGDRMDKDTGNWRDATDLELEQKEYIRKLEKRIEQLEEIKDWVLSNHSDNEHIMDIINDKRT